MTATETEMRSAESCTTKEKANYPMAKASLASKAVVRVCASSEA